VPGTKIKITPLFIQQFLFYRLKTGGIDEEFIIQLAKELDRNKDSSVCK
jgi:hypothetical protein